MTISEGFSPGYVEQQEALIADLRRMLNESAAVHADLKESMIKMVADVAIWRTRAERAEAALATANLTALSIIAILSDATLTPLTAASATKAVDRARRYAIAIEEQTRKPSHNDLLSAETSEEAGAHER